MASPRRIFRIYHQLGQDAELLRDFLQAKGDKVPGTVNLLCQKDAGKLLAKWGVEMDELCGVLDGSHDDPFTMEANQTYYWASLYAVVQGLGWDELGWDALRAGCSANATGVGTIADLRTQVTRLVEAGPEAAKPPKLFLLWLAAYRLYCGQTPAEQQISLEQLMEVDLHEMRSRVYLEPILRQITE